MVTAWPKRATAMRRVGENAIQCAPYALLALRRLSRRTPRRADPGRRRSLMGGIDTRAVSHPSRTRSVRAKPWRRPLRCAPLGPACANGVPVISVWFCSRVGCEYSQVNTSAAMATRLATSVETLDAVEPGVRSARFDGVSDRGHTRVTPSGTLACAYPESRPCRRPPPACLIRPVSRHDRTLQRLLQQPDMRAGRTHRARCVWTGQ